MAMTVPRYNDEFSAVYIVMAYIGMANNSYGLYSYGRSQVQRQIVMAYIVMAYVLMVYIVMSYVLMVYIVMAYIVMAYYRLRPFAGTTTSRRRRGRRVTERAPRMSFGSARARRSRRADACSRMMQYTVMAYMSCGLRELWPT